MTEVSGRYAVGTLLGQGGMAEVYQATDLVSGRQVALKRFTLPRENRHYRESASLFEHEFLMLAQLSHPRIIEVYDYSVAESGPYYTMELVDGGDLRERTPMPWRDACSVIYDICSSLALIHSRRLVHRDISPRNIRCSRDGQAKLIDFGALVPMGPGDLIVGTPQFVAPEVVYRAALDARTDLFSLGATFYYTLTGRVPYAAKTFQQLADAWETKPQPPSLLVDGVPAALDPLVLSLVSTDPANRPRSAFEVMQRLAAIADLARVEPASVSRAYLSTPTMVGREGVVAAIGRQTASAFSGAGRGVLIQATAGLGRSRVLDAAALAAKALGTTVLRAYGGATTNEGFKVAHTLVERFVDAAPEVALATARAEGVDELLFENQRSSQAPSSAPARPRVREFVAQGSSRVALQSALGRWFLALSRQQPLAIAVDDLHRIDEPSMALLAALGSQIERERMVLLATAEVDAAPTDSLAFEVFRKNSSVLSLAPLGHGDIEQLFVSVFGDVPNVRFLSDDIDAIAAGNPRAAMDLAQHLVDNGMVRYEGGAWTLPSHLEPADLPATAEGALQARIAALSPLSRSLAQAHALATHHAFTRDDYALIGSQVPRAETDSAVGDLVSAQLVLSDGRVYTIANQGVRAALRSSLTPPELAERHRVLAALYEGRTRFGVVRHALLGGLEAQALDQIGPLLLEAPERSSLLDTTADIGSAEMVATFERALSAAERLGRPQREIYDLRRWLSLLSVVTDRSLFARVAPAWLERLKLDSGYSAWDAHPELRDPAERLKNAMRLAYERYAATPDGDRVYRPDEAIGGLVRFVTAAIAIATGQQDCLLFESLPRLLEPFAPINPLVDIMWQNALATRELACRVRPERCREIWIRVCERLGNVTGDDAQYATLIRNAVALGLGICEAWMGMESAMDWAERMDDDPLQRVSALQLRRTVRMQLGDADGAEQLRRQAEILGLQAQSRQMLNVTQVEINACALAGDLTTLKQCIDHVRGFVRQAPGWAPVLRLAEGRFHLLCGNFEAALEATESTLALLETPAGPVYPLSSSWCGAVAGRTEALIGLERFEEARDAGERALQVCERLEIGVPAQDISRTLALAEARLGSHEKASARLSTLIAEQLTLGISGLRLGASYEARARVAIWARDPAGADQYMRLTAREYRYGRGSALGARYERLLLELQRAGGQRLPALSEFESAVGSTNHTAATVVVTKAMRGAEGVTERAERALDLLCDERAAAVGHLYLFTGDGVRLAASRGSATPPDGFVEFVHGFLARELAEDATETRMADAIADDVQVVETHFTDLRGVRFYPILLKGMLDDELRYAGVVALAFHDRPKPSDEKLLAAVSCHLVECGDTAGLKYGSWQTAPPRA